MVILFIPIHNGFLKSRVILLGLRILNLQQKRIILVLIRFFYSFCNSLLKSIPKNVQLQKQVIFYDSYFKGHTAFVTDLFKWILGPFKIKKGIITFKKFFRGLKSILYCSYIGTFSNYSKRQHY